MDWLRSIATWAAQWLGGPVDYKQIILIGMSPIFLLTLVVEWYVMRRRGTTAQFELKDVITSLNLGLTYQMLELVLHAFILLTAMDWVYAHRIYSLPINAWSILPLFVLVEFLYYWFHRTSHRVRWFWCAHVVHHSGEYMNLSTAMRQSMLYSLTGYWLFFTPLMLIGVSPELTMTMYAIDLSYQFFVHTESIKKLPDWYEYVFVTPSHHRAHHGRNPQYIDKNYGGILILFDRWFGTFEEEKEPVDYGIVRQIHSNNILVLNLHEFLDMIRDIKRSSGSFMQRLKHLWAPPEWQRGSTVPTIQ